MTRKITLHFFALLSHLLGCKQPSGISNPSSLAYARNGAFGLKIIGLKLNNYYTGENNFFCLQQQNVSAAFTDEAGNNSNNFLHSKLTFKKATQKQDIFVLPLLYNRTVQLQISCQLLMLNLSSLIQIACVYLLKPTANRVKAESFQQINIYTPRTLCNVIISFGLWACSHKAALYL